MQTRVPAGPPINCQYQLHSVQEKKKGMCRRSRAKDEVLACGSYLALAATTPGQLAGAKHCWVSASALKSWKLLHRQHGLSLTVKQAVPMY